VIKVFIVDDHATVREGLKQILSETSDIVVAGEAPNSLEVLDRVHIGDWDIVLLDIAMPGRGGLDTLEQLKRERPQLPVLMLSMYPEEQYAVRSLRAGASGYLTKESAPEELTKAIRKVSHGERYVSALLSEKLAL
jgi:DNA-binding NarL/FixJ family response regulator